MYLFKNNNDKRIIVYSFFPNKDELIEYKKKNIDSIKSVIVHINNKEVEDIFLKGDQILFRAVDRKEENGRISYIQETKNSDFIARYINGDFDHLFPFNLIGHVPSHKSHYSGDLNNEDSVLLFNSGYYKSYNEFETDESILLTDSLQLYQPLLSEDINNLCFPYFLNHINEDLISFLRMFNCIKERIISLDDMKFLQENGIIDFNNNVNDIFENSERVLDCYKKVKKITKSKNYYR